MSTITAHSEIARKLITALENNEHEQAATYLTDDFLCGGWTPRPLGKKAFLHVISNLKEGLPDLSFHLHDLQEQNEQLVSGTIQVTGYQENSFEIADLGLPPIPQTAGHVSLPATRISFEIIDEHIKQIIVAATRDGNLQGLIRQLGIDVPIIQ